MKKTLPRTKSLPSRLTAMERRVLALERRMAATEQATGKVLAAVEGLTAKVEAWHHQDYQLRNEELPRHMAPIISGLNALDRRLERIDKHLASLGCAPPPSETSA